MRRLFRQVRVVKIEIADAAAVGECSPVRRRLVIGAKDRGSMFRREISRYSSRDYKRFFLPSAERAAKGIDYAPFHFVHHFLRKVLKSQRARVISKLMSKRCLHVKNRDSNLPMIFTGARAAQELVRSSAGKQTGRPINAAGFSVPRLRPLISAFGRDRCWSTGPPSCPFQTRRA